MARTPLAWKNLSHQPTRTAVSIGGISFAILLMYMQLGFLGAVGDTATNVYSRVPFDLVVRSPEYLHAYDPRSVDERVISIVQGVPGVAAVMPLDLGLAKWQHPTTGDFRPLAVMGVDLHRMALDLPEEVDRKLSLLRRPDHVFVDRTSRPDYGPANDRQFGPADIGRTTTINRQRVRIAGTFEMGTGLAANGAVLTSRAGFNRLMLGDQTNQVSMVFVKLTEGVTVAEGMQRVRQNLRRSGGKLGFVRVLDQPATIRAEQRRWYLQTPIGIIFAMGVALAVLVGGVVCYMVLASDVIAHLPEYATLKAMGYGGRFLAGTLLVQAFLLAVISLPLATAAALVLYRITSDLASVPIRMTLGWISLVSVLSLLMCSMAGMVALRKLAKAEPASLF